MILSVNTSVPEFSLAISDPEGIVLGEVYVGLRRENYKDMVPSLEWLLGEVGIKINQITKVFVAAGPGRFTGLRVGLAFAKGLCYALKVPLYGVNSLDALSYNIPMIDKPLAVFIESRREEWFMGFFEPGIRGRPRRNSEDLVVTKDSLREMLKKETYILGHDYKNQAGVLSDALGKSALLMPPWFWAFRSAGLIQGGLERSRECEPEHLGELEPYYLRGPEIRTTGVKIP